MLGYRKKKLIKMSKEILQADFIPVDLDNLLHSNGDSRLQFDMDSFGKGLTEGSFFAGLATSLFNAGLEEESVAKLLEVWMVNHGC